MNPDSQTFAAPPPLQHNHARYDLSGHVVAEDYGTGWGPGYVYAGGQLIAEYANSTTYFVHGSHLGSSSVLTSVAGAVVDCNALYPFGEQDNTICTTSNITTHKFTGKERDSESGLDNFGARYNASSLGRFMSADPVFMNVMRVMDPQRLNLYSYARNNPLLYTDPTGKDIVAGSGDQGAIKSALVEIARHPGGREFLTKLDKLSAEIKVSTGTGLTNRNGDSVYGKTTGNFQRVTDSSGAITDVKGHVETTIDPALAKQDRSDAVPGAPKSDAELLGHELKHDENQFFKQPDSEEGATKGIDDILNQKPTKETKQGAEEFVDNLLKPNSQNNQNNQQQPPPPPPCTAEKDKPCPK